MYRAPIYSQFQARDDLTAEFGMDFNVLTGDRWAIETLAEQFQLALEEFDKTVSIVDTIGEENA